ncbi:MAG: TIGR00282 family metallophosphoesterase [Oscillospiraceae bacterium]|nr:TIGR00282 family metallophosphoesterase [Oscillospiraceae bacterium]
MNILCIGDVVGTGGCNFLRRHLPQIKKEYSVDFVIANGENSADGNGIMPYSAEHIMASGVDVITTGNHAFKRKESPSLFENNAKVLRPANLWGDVDGYGYYIADLGKARVAVINLIGTVYMNSADNPFNVADRLLSKIDADFIIVDIHAEATSEKQALAYYLDGRVSAVFGTHTHTQTSDADVLPKGTGFITDVGMVGAVNSVLGIEPSLIIEKFRKSKPVKFQVATGKMKLCAVLFELDDKTHLCKSVKYVNIVDDK